MAESVSVDITLEEKRALQALSKLSRGFEEFESDAKKSTKGVDDSLSSIDIALGNFAANIGTKVFDVVSDAFFESIGRVRDFEKGIIEINTLLPQSEKLTKELSKEIKGLSREFATSPTAQTEAFYQIISSGAASGAEAVDLLRQANTAATGGLADVSSTVNVLTDILNVYGAENISAKEAADSLFQTVRLGKTNLEQLSTSIGQILPQANEFEVSLDDVGAALATMTAQGLTTSQRVTQLRALFSALSRQGGNVEKFGDQMGKAFSRGALEAKGLSRFLQDVVKTADDTNTNIIELVGSVEAEQAVLALASQDFESFNSNLEEFSEKSDAARKAADEVKESMDFEFSQAEQNIQTITDTLVENLTPAARDAAKVLNLFVEEFTASPSAQDLQEEIRATEERILSLGKSLRAEQAGETSWLQRIFGTGDREKNVERIKTQMDEMRERLRLLKEERDNLPQFGPPIPEPESDTGEEETQKAVEKEKKKQEKVTEAVLQKRRERQARLQILEEEISLMEDERRIAEQENMLERREMEIERLKEFEIRKANIEFEAQLEKNNKIKDAREQDLADQQAIAQRSLAIQKAQSKAEKDIEEARVQNREKMVEGFARATGQAEQLFKEGTAAQQALGSANAVINTYIAANKALSTYPPPASFAVAATTIATGLANVAKINGASFQSGGVVGGFSGASAGRDTQVANVREGEMFLNAQQQRELFDIANGRGERNEGLVQAINNLANRPVVIETDGKEIGRVVRTAKESGLAV